MSTKPFLELDDLEVYQAARGFRRRMYQVSRRLPKDEQFVLVPQIRRAAVSLTNNIAEGHGRYHYLDNIRFTLIARGSLIELIDDLNICEDELYVPLDEIASLRQDSLRVRQLMNGYIRYLRERKAGDKLIFRESGACYRIADDLPDDL